MVVLALLLAAGAGAADRTVVVLGTATPGGGFPFYGQALAQTVNALDPTIEVQPRNTRGSADTFPCSSAARWTSPRAQTMFHRGR